MHDNPLLERAPLPRIEAVKPEHVVPAVKHLLQQNRAAIEKLLVDAQPPAWDNLARPMEELAERLHDCWSVVNHLHGVQNSDALREAYDEALSMITAYETELGQNSGLYQAYLGLQHSGALEDMGEAPAKAVENILRDFRLSGVALNERDKHRFAELQQELAQLATTFSNNVLDATRGWYKHLVDASRLQGVPDTVLQSLRQQAQARQLEGYVISLDIPCYLPVMQYASDRALREELYTAYNTRASELGPNGGQWDNSQVMEQIIKARHELAELLGFANYAELSLATKMAADPQQVLDFLHQLAAQSRAAALREYAELEAFAHQRDKLDALQAWDIPYYAELLRQSLYALSEEELRPYFPAPGVIAGMFDVVGRLFAVQIERDDQVSVYHPDVSFYRVSQDGEEIAAFYLDPYARADKRGGAWMADCRNRYRDDQGKVQLPVAFLTCNFSPPSSGESEATPSLLTHNEVTTLFHEFGHGLHHMLTRVDVAAVSGINGVAWDAVELPSQMLENWCWQESALGLISGHYQTGDALPAALLEKLLAARNFQSGMMMVRQLELALFDFTLHLGYDPAAPPDIQQLLDQVRSEVAVVPIPAVNRFQHGFAHIFAGGYAAGYYSYKWAEVLSSDAFSRFEEEGVLSPDTGASFLRHILQMGGSREPAVLFREFRGRDPDTEALLRHSGIL